MENQSIKIELSEKELDVMSEIIESGGSKSKQDLGVRASLMGAATRENFGVQDGRLLRLGLVESPSGKVPVIYSVTDFGKKVWAFNRAEQLMKELRTILDILSA